MDEVLRRGREAYARCAWSDALDALFAADRAAPLDGDDLERLATAAYLAGRNAEFVTALERAHNAHVSAGRNERAARCAFWLALNHLMTGEPAACGGWLAHAGRLLEGRDCAEQGYLMLPPIEQQLRRPDPAAARDTARQAAEIGVRFGDADLVALARHAQGRALIDEGQAAEGLQLLDEVMLSVVHGHVSPMATGLLYCSVIQACRGLFELRRAGEWTAAFERWCECQHGLVAFTGDCRVHRAEILQWHGAWPDALQEAALACERIQGGGEQSAAAAAMALQGDLHRLRGDFAAAEEAYRRASRLGLDPQPGLALLRKAQGRCDAACAAIRRSVAQTSVPLERARLLPALVEIVLAAGQLADARAASAELEAVSARYGTPALSALAVQARGAVELAGGDVPAALVALRRAFDAWRELDAPYEAARVRLLLAQACSALEDEEAGELERDAARCELERLGAAPDLAALRAGRHSKALTERERQVLRLVADGNTNKAIAQALSLSERTVDRHLSNIFDKLGVSSRAAATACAYEHRLL
jgi:DNA-binding CsgD family transcriptional regulator